MGTWLSAMADRAYENKKERERYAYLVKTWERDYEEQCQYARMKWEDKCAEIDAANQEAYDVAKAVWEVSTSSVHAPRVRRARACAHRRFARMCV